MGIAWRDGAFADRAVLAVVFGEEVEEACWGSLRCMSVARGGNAHGDVWEDEGGGHLFHAQAAALIALFEEGVLGMTAEGRDGNLGMGGL